MEETPEPLAIPLLPDSRDTPSMEDRADNARPGLTQPPHFRTEPSGPLTRLRPFRPGRAPLWLRHRAGNFHRK